MLRLQEIKGTVKREELLSRHTTFKIGGPAEFFIEPRGRDELKFLLGEIKKHKLRLFVLGAGSNVLVNDKGLRGVVVRLGSAYFKKIRCQGSRVCAGGGVSLSCLVSFCVRNGLKGAEFLAGIPGTVGGALVMNAGAWGKNIEDLVDNIEIMDYNGNIKKLGKEAAGFKYRRSGLSKTVVLSADFLLSKGNSRDIKKKAQDYLKKRRKTQAVSYPSAGCIFKNPRSSSAGRLIDLCGFKGERLSGAQVSVEHANFIINASDASSQDVQALMRKIKKEVKKRYNIRLTEEIKIWK